MMDFHSAPYMHSKKRSHSCPPPNEGEERKGSLLPVVFVLGGAAFAFVIWRDRKRLRELGEDAPGGGTTPGSRRTTSGSAAASGSGSAAAAGAGGPVRGLWCWLRDLVWRPAPSLRYKGRAWGASSEEEVAQGEQSTGTGAGGVAAAAGSGGSGGGAGGDAAALLEVTDVGPCALHKFEEGRWQLLSRSAPCRFVPIPPPAGSTLATAGGRNAGSDQPAPPSAPPAAETAGSAAAGSAAAGPAAAGSAAAGPAAAGSAAAGSAAGGAVGWVLQVGPARSPLVHADVSEDLQLRQAPGELGVKFKWDGGFWSLQLPNQPALALFMSAFRVKQQCARSRLAHRAATPAGQAAPSSKRPGGDVKVEDILN